MEADAAKAARPGEQATSGPSPPRSACPFWEEEWQSQATTLKAGGPPFVTETRYTTHVNLLYEGATHTFDGHLVKQPFVMATYPKGKEPAELLAQGVVKLLHLYQEALSAAGGDLFTESTILRETLDEALKDRERLAQELDRVQAENQTLKAERAALAQEA